MPGKVAVSAGLRFVQLLGNSSNATEHAGGGEGGEITAGWAAASPDGEEWPPFYTVFKNPPRIYVAACCISLFLAAANIIGFALFARRILGCPSSTRRGLFTRMACYIPILAASSCLSLAFPKIGVMFALVRDAYTGLLLLWHAELMVEMMGGFHSSCVAIASNAVANELHRQSQQQEHRGSLYLSASSQLEQQQQPSMRIDPEHVSVSVEDLKRSSDLLVGVWYGVSQYCYANTGLGVLWCVLCGLGVYEEGILPQHWALLTLKVLQLIAALAAMAAVAVQYAALHGPLMRTKFSSSFKLLFVVLAILFCNCQPFVLSLLFLEGEIPNTALFATRARSALWNSFFLSWEASALLLLVVKALRIAELFDPEVREPLKGEGFDWDLSRLSLFPVRSYGAVGRPARFTTGVVVNPAERGHWSGIEASGQGGVARGPLVASRSSYPQYEGHHDGTG